MNLISKIKNLLKYILPPPVHAFNREVAEIKRYMRELNAGLEVQQRQQQMLLDKLTAPKGPLQTSIHEAKDSMAKEIAGIKAIVPNQPIFWSNEDERRVVKENWGDITQSDDFADKFIRLTQGMDAKSVETVIRILKRQNAYLNIGAKSMDLFTREEQEELRLLKENFKSEIIKLSDDLFAYRNYLLPINHFESSVFYYKHGIGDLDNPAAAKGKAIIDVGGFVGDSVLVLSELEPSIIYTFEAVPDNFELLKKRLNLIKFKT